MERDQANAHLRGVSREVSSLGPFPQARRQLLYEHFKSELYRQAVDVNRASFFRPPSLERTVEQSGLVGEVFSPLDDLFTNPDSPRSERAAAIIWARITAEEYEALPKANSSQRRRASRFMDGVVDHLIRNPKDIDAATSTWDTDYLSSLEEDREATNFTETIQKHSSTRTREVWSSITDDQLASLLRAATHSQAGGLLAKTIIENYFKEPKSEKQSVDAMYKFASAALSLIDDMASLQTAMKMGVYDYSDDTKSVAEPYLDMVIAREFALDDGVLVKAINADSILFGLYKLAGLNYRELARKAKYFETSNEPFRRRRNRVSQGIEGRIGGETFRRRDEALRKSRFIVSSSPQEMAEYRQNWPNSLVLADPLRVRFQQEAVSLVDTVTMRGAFANRLGTPGGEKPLSISIRRPDGLVVETLIPHSLIGQRSELIRKVLAESDIPKDDQQRIVGSQFGSASTILMNEFRGVAMMAWVRKASGLEGRLHPLTALEEIGFPVPVLEDGVDIISANQALARTVRTGRERFLDYRGFRSIKGLPSALRQLGYQSFDFLKHRAQPDNTLVRVNVLNLPPYEVRLDRFLNFDWEGQTFEAPGLAQNLRYTLLRCLELLFCEKELSLEGMTQEEATRVITRRVGHYRLLPPGQEYSKGYALLNCEELEGEDLRAKDLANKAEQRAGGVPEDQLRFTTYVKPVVTNEDDMPPLEIAFPDTVRF